jgi:hypothetical protein
MIPEGFRNIVKKPLPVEQGGTGEATVTEARSALNVPTLDGTNQFTGENRFDGITRFRLSGPYMPSGSQLTESVTTSRTWSLPDKDGDIALTSDITGGLADGDYGDVVVSGSGTAMTVECAHISVDGGTTAGILDASYLTGIRTYALPDADGTFMLTAIKVPYTFDYVDTTLTSAQTAFNASDEGSAITITLPDAATVGAGKIYIIKNSGTVSQNIATTSSQTIDGSAPGTLSVGSSLRLMSDGTNWITW